MKNGKFISPIFYIASLYDGLIGLAFLFGSGALFSQLGVTPPNHHGYVQFPAALLIVFAIMFAAIAKDPIKNRNLILYGILLKVSYCGVVLFHWIATDLPGMWKPFFIFDLIFLVLFVWVWTALKDKEDQVA